MILTDFFNFEEKELDFPFYNSEPFLSKGKWALLILSIVLFIAIIFVPINISETLVSILLFLVTFLPLAYACKGKLHLFFRKVRLTDIKTILLCLVAYYVYTFIISQLLTLVGIVPQPNAVLSSDMNLIFWISILIQLMGEELFKIILMLTVMHGLYLLTENRKLSLVCGVLVSILAFGLIHYNVYGVLAQVILIIGLGSIFEMYTYLKTKNVFVSYLLHVLTDSIVFILTMLLGV